uniref:Uncharacterized protein n=1 Tax=Pelusios castaneus TaxID=367368 RepID=A0A8C8VHZ5_9SAUR
MMNISLKVLLALALWMMTTDAFPKGHHRAKCHLAKYKSLPPWELEAFKKAKDKFEDIMLCLSFCHITDSVLPTSFSPQVHDRMILVEKELDFTIDMLEDIEDSNLSELFSRPLEILTQIREDLRSCVRTILTGSRPRGQDYYRVFCGALSSLSFNRPKPKETPGYLEASVILNLFRLLNEDLKCTAYMEHCV